MVVEFRYPEFLESIGARDGSRICVWIALPVLIIGPIREPVNERVSGPGRKIRSNYTAQLVEEGFFAD